MPPYLAGRESEAEEFSRLLGQDVVLQNLVLTGLRGVGKTVLLESLKPAALARGWLWVGTDLSESATVSEANIIVRLATDLSVVTRALRAEVTGPSTVPIHGGRALDYQALRDRFNATPGLHSDRLKSMLQLVWTALQPTGKVGIVFAYDEAQNLADHATRREYPLSLLLDVFQSLQRQGLRFMLALTGLPTLFPKLVEARTYAERMFHVINLGPLDLVATRQAILRPMEAAKSPIRFHSDSVDTITEMSAGYPYFIQYICRECFDIWVSNTTSGEPLASIPVDEITRKLDADFFAGRWSRATDRQRDLLLAIANRGSSEPEFTVQEVVESSRRMAAKPFSSSHVNQMLGSLSEMGLVYKNRWGKYSLAVPLLDKFVRRARATVSEQEELETGD
jgi:AAA ATPase-like protein